MAKPSPDRREAEDGQVRSLRSRTALRAMEAHTVVMIRPRTLMEIATHGSTSGTAPLTGAVRPLSSW